MVGCACSFICETQVAVGALTWHKINVSTDRSRVYVVFGAKFVHGRLLLRVAVLLQYSGCMLIKRKKGYPYST